MTPPILSVRNLSVGYHQQPILTDVQLTIDQPALIGMIGPNGAGKSTLLKAMLGLLPGIAGEVRFFGEPFRKVRRRIGYVPQRESVDWDFPVSVADVVRMGTYSRLGWFRIPGASEQALVRQCLERVGLADYANAQIGQLSGGQQQRTFLARALAQQADLYLMDEPMAGVDAVTERSIFELLRELRQQGRTVIVVHHDLRSVPEYFDEVILVNRRILAHGATASVFTADRLQETYAGRLAIVQRAE
ncbi:metal ABC transporter ATP-binding protein [Tuwongella immobilis]|uniref:ABC transporter domain-containing protein n=1 Tax=Tuwongella immobilis TaxID=692036 RepID=A0A6C2YML6_9BACT|nr:metal ABC transporter ATP-binding protein [Tuwongella immobilis]VIP02363.1 manganese abc transporter atp-binding protein : ABC transporter related protein OS=Pirellula staleyi (strain ATCC 27377 / DSM 6068 / ICPB 4128) GN=Psta_4675 PE=3 SV=1: ABC_tran [Tuwongella immobilis]VTS01175.1 manganese abc transporter atp-binding protein : ABC transporter related protein OS=Pirellula staleyi (strain ATCC 27377 / DSM 6068 / ICPB 4128) GN=Psta_4675 PE=3 SV=1: ABC_tran [Tuwongella immobilis]